MDEWDALGTGMKVDRRATDWGLASLGVCGCMLIMAPIQLIFNDFYWSVGIHHAARDEIQQARMVAPLVAFGFLGLIGFGIFCGARGMSVARATGQAVALPLAGVVVGCLDMLLWIGLSINLMAILGMFL